MLPFNALLPEWQARRPAGTKGACNSVVRVGEIYKEKCE